MEITSEYIAPWAIAREDIPLHLIWKSDAKEFDFIEVHFPKELQIKEVLNVHQFQEMKSKIRFSDYDLLSSDYFGLVATSTTIYEDLVKKMPITISFFSGDNEIFSKIFTANIVRPMISIQNPPSEIVIEDNTNRNELLKYEVIHKGLGKVKIEFTASAKGDIISQSDSLYFEVLQEIAQDFSKGELKDDSVSLQVPDVGEFSFDPIMIQDHTTNILDMLKSGHFPSTIRKEIFNELSELANDPEARNALIKIIYSKLQKLFISYLLYYFDKSPHEDIELPVGKIKMNLNFGIKFITLKITYTDSYENSYDPVESTLKIDDRRHNHDKFQIPINIKWTSEPIQIKEISQ